MRRRHINRGHWNPVLPQKEITNFVDDLFGRSISEIVGHDFSLSRPSVNVVENDDAYNIQLAAPGLEKSNFDVKTEKDQLVVTAKKESESSNTEEGKYTRREFNYTSFTRSFQLPKSIDRDGIGANYENGILYITIPKVIKTETENTNTIEIS